MRPAFIPDFREGNLGHQDLRAVSVGPMKGQHFSRDLKFVRSVVVSKRRGVEGSNQWLIVPKGVS